MNTEETKQVVGFGGGPTRPERSMVAWFRDNVLALLLIVISGIGTYTIAEKRLTVLEIKVNTYERQAAKTEEVIDNNTRALNKIAVIFATVDGKLETFGLRLTRLEEK
jgi:hypothetical protein